MAVKKIDGGIFSSYVIDFLKKGDVLELMPPKGAFFTQANSKNAGNYIAFAAGSGITPIISIIKTLLESEPNSTLNYSILIAV